MSKPLLNSQMRLSPQLQAPCTVKISLRTGTEARPNLFQDKRKTKLCLSAAVNTRPIILLFIFFIIFFSRANTSSGRAHDKKNSQFERTTKNQQKPRYFSGSIHDQTFPQVDYTNKNLLTGTNNSKMLLGCNTAGRERHEPTTRKTCATNKLKISGNRGPNGIKALRL